MYIVEFLGGNFKDVSIQGNAFILKVKQIKNRELGY
jgi:hypothetical protein